ncbi:MAG: hypothetical protein NWF04_10385 [Candidatus Bathyarchaeota archaeon]|nr:hypothetical protein [Candidatus Bathyarchaeota archaeon]
MDELTGYEKGFVQCCDCKNLESYWKDGNVVFFLCRFKPVAMKTLYQRWRRCKFFTYTTQTPLDRRNNIK